MTIDELIAIVRYKKENIKAHISPSTFEEIENILIKYKEMQEPPIISGAKNFCIDDYCKALEKSSRRKTDGEKNCSSCIFCFQGHCDVDDALVGINCVCNRYQGR